MSSNVPTYFPSYSFIAVLLTVAIGASSAPQVLAQERQEMAENSLQAGAWALEFNVGQNFTLDPFLGSTISGKRHVSDARAWQAGLTLGARVRSRDENNQTTSDDWERVTLTARYLSYPLLGEQNSETVQLYMGAGPRLTFNRNSRTQDQGGQESSRTSIRWGVGISGTVGAEWFVHPRISLTGAYEASLLYQREHVEESDTETAPSETLFNLNPGGVRFGASVYF